MNQNHFEVDVSPEMQLYKILQRQSYEIGTALAEFVDNSVQSFLEQNDAIKVVEEGEPNLRVQIIISPQEKRITIEDNAGGIDRANFQRALRMGHEQDRGLGQESLSVYGIGMKSSAIWFSNSWTIETSALGSQEKLTTTFDLDHLLATGETKIEVNTNTEEVKNHYTKITINDCLRDLSDNKDQFEDSVLPYLRETFFKFEQVFVEITYDGSILKTNSAQLTEPTPLVYPRVDKNGNKVSDIDVTWKKRLDFMHNGKPVRGFVMIMDTGAYHGPGIRLLRNRRVIFGTQGGNRQNKPPMLLGTSNKYPPQRIYGELHLNDFPVNFMKTGFDINMDSLYRALQSELITGEPEVKEDYIFQATHFRRKLATTDPKKPKSRNTKKTRRKPDDDNKNQVPFSDDLHNALKQLESRKIYRLYVSLCRVSLTDDPVLAYVGAWTLLESLATLMGKVSEAAFKDFYNRHFRHFDTDRAQKKDCKKVIEDIHARGNMNKHSGIYEAMNAQQLASDFPTIEKFLIHCAQETVKGKS